MAYSFLAAKKSCGQAAGVPHIQGP